jgi:hypothetical protein
MGRAAVNPLEEALQQILDLLIEELRRQAPAIHEAGRTLIATAWQTLATNGQGGPGAVLTNPGPEGSVLGSLWDPIAKPFSEGAMEELEARVREMVAPTVKRIAAAAAGGGIAAGWFARGLMR